MHKRNLLLVALFVLVLGGLAWAFLPAGGDPQVEKVVQMQQKLFDENSDVPREERREAFRALRDEVEKLTPEQRDKLMRDNPPPPMRRMQQRVVAFFELPEEERTAALDKQIDEMEERRKEWEKRRRERGDAKDRGERRGPPGFGRNMSQEQRNQRRKRMLDNTDPQQRAMFGEYFRQIQARRQQRGLPPMRGPFGR